MSKEQSEQQAQQKYMELHFLQQQAQQVQKQVQALEAQANEMEVVQRALDEFGGMKVGSDMFATLTPGVFVKAELRESDKVLLNVGGGAVVQKTVPQAKEVIAEQEKELRKLKDELSEQLRQLGERVESVQKEMQELLK